MNIFGPPDDQLPSAPPAPRFRLPIKLVRRIRARAAQIVEYGAALDGFFSALDLIS